VIICICAEQLFLMEKLRQQPLDTCTFVKTLWGFYFA